MTISRREFLATSVAGAASLGLSDAATQPSPVASASAPGAFDPWLEIDAAALRHNVQVIGRLASSRPVLVVAKNNAYGLGLGVVGPILDPAPEVWGFAVVRPDEAAALRTAGVKKPILLMAPVGRADVEELVNRDVRVTPFDDG